MDDWPLGAVANGKLRSIIGMIAVKVVLVFTVHPIPDLIDVTNTTAHAQCDKCRQSKKLRQNEPLTAFIT
jgi:hypothetical protein